MLYYFIVVLHIDFNIFQWYICIVTKNHINSLLRHSEKERKNYVKQKLFKHGKCNRINKRNEQ